MANAGSLAVGIKSGKRWHSGCWDKKWQTLAVWLLGQRVANAGSLAVGIKSGKRWQSGCTQGCTRLNSKRTFTALSLTRGLSHSDRLGPWPSVWSRHAMDLNQNIRSRHRNWDLAPGSRRRSRSPKYAKKRGKRGGKGESGREGLNATCRSVPGTVLALANEEQS